MPVVHLLAAGGSTLENLSTLDPASPSAESIRFLFLFVSAVSVFILAIIWGVLSYSLARFRGRQARTSEGVEKEPPQVYGSMPIEIAWTVAPGLIVFLLSLVIIRTEFEVRVKPRPPSANVVPVNITVIGHQWWWEYQIDSDNGGPVNVVTANELHVPTSGAGTDLDVSRPIYFTLKSADVCHSFWIPRLGGKTDLIPGRVNQMSFETDAAGLHLGQCAEYCGTQHANMLLRVYADAPQDFASWLANEQKPAVDDSSVRDGRRAFLVQSCINCHTVRGTPARGKVGPDLTHFAARQTMAGGMIERNGDNLRRWIANPQETKPGTLMPAFGDLGSRDVQLITDYLMTLK